MSYTRALKKLSRSKKIGALLLVGTLAWAGGFPGLINLAYAIQVEDFRDTLVSSAPGASTDHAVQFTLGANATAGQTIRITFSAGNSGGASNEFLLTSFATDTDVTIAGATEVANAGACGAGGDELYNSLVNNIPGFRFVEFTICPGDSILDNTVLTFSFNGDATRIVNPTTVGSYVIRVEGTSSNSGDTRVAIVDQVTMSAIVPTSLTFTVSGVASSTALFGGQTTSTTTSTTTIGFGILDVADDEIGAQLLTVATNAFNGYAVTVVQNQNLLSNSGADIDVFDDGVVGAPAAWNAPSNVLGSEDTYGHYGLTSDDSVLSGGNPFSGGTLYSGNFVAGSPLEVMFHNGPVAADSGRGIGTTTVAYRIQIASLQEAANDYTNTLTYVCTPIF